MKNIKRVVAVVLALVLCFSSITVEAANAKSKSIYFAGDYKRKIKYGDYYRIELNKYSSPEGKNVGNYRIYYYSSVSGGEHSWSGGELKKTGTNSYKGGKYQFKIYKKKLVLKKAGALSGTYKLKKRYPRP